MTAKGLLFAIGIVSTLGTPGHASVLVDKPLDVSTTASGFVSDKALELLGEDFQLSSAAIVNRVTFYGRNLQFIDGRPQSPSVPDGSFDVFLFSDAGGIPATLALSAYNTGAISGVFVGTDLGNSVGVIDNVYAWTVTIPDVILPSPGTYWISIRGNDSNRQFIWENSSPSGDEEVAVRLRDDGPWRLDSLTGPFFEGRDTQAIRIEGDVIDASIPIPGGISLLAGGLAGLGWSRRKK